MSGNTTIVSNNPTTATNKRLTTTYHRRAHEAAEIHRLITVNGTDYLIVATKEPGNGWVGYVRDKSGLVAESIAGCNLASLERYAVDCLGGN
jgi:hypothetical protein